MNESFSQIMRALDPEAESFGPQLANQILKHAVECRASDIHIVPSAESTLLNYRIDGVLQTIAGFEPVIGQRLVARYKVLSGLLTYRSDQPQEGRIRTGRLAENSGLSEVPELKGDVRIATFPTLFGEKVAIRLFSNSDSLQQLSDLGLPDDVSLQLKTDLQQTSGVILITGPSGSGKTTTAYACLRQLLQDHGTHRSLMSLEDPIEMIVPGMTQSQVKPESDFDLANGLKAMLRQDPDVIMVGEIRDPVTAENAFQAALTGHLVLTTFHAGSASEAVTRLLDMGLEPYLLSSTLRSVVCQRLLRKRCDACGVQRKQTESEKLESPLDENQPDDARQQQSSCPECDGLKYRGRFVTAEIMDMTTPGTSELLKTAMDAEERQAKAMELGMLDLKQRCQQAVAANQTDQLEVFRVLGRGSL
ncbi:MAG: GspE/PulE family protein [Fuerstiella sp.]